jgi:hypothetical protein
MKVKEKRARLLRLSRDRDAALHPAAVSQAVAPLRNTRGLSANVQHLLHFMQALLRFSVPIYCVLVLHYDPARMVCLYFIDTWLGLTAVFSLLILSFLPPRDWDAPTEIEWFTNMTGTILTSALIASLFMVVAFMPLLVAHEVTSLKTIMLDPHFQRIVGWHAFFTLVTFASQAWELGGITESMASPILSRRFKFIFFRWMAVYAVMFSPIPLDFLGAKGLAIAFVIVYSAFGFACEMAPERMGRVIGSLTNEKPS